jgi:hypothetical protein
LEKYYLSGIKCPNRDWIMKPSNKFTEFHSCFEHKLDIDGVLVKNDRSLPSSHCAQTSKLQNMNVFDQNNFPFLQTNVKYVSFISKKFSSLSLR